MSLQFRQVFSRLALFCAVALCMTAVSVAGTINYGDFSDIPPGAVMYLDVTESSPPIPPPLYGPPTVIGNSLQFLNISGDFIATPEFPDDDETLDVRLNTRVMTLGEGNGLSSLRIFEQGTYQHTGLADSDAQVSAALQAFVTVLAVDGTPLTNGDIFTLNQSDSFLSSIANNGQVVAGVWELGALFEFVPELISRGFGEDALVTKAQVVIDNRLNAIESPGSTAFIDKKGFRIIPGGELNPDVIIPEPASLAMLLTMTGLVLVRRQQRA